MSEKLTNRTILEIVILVFIAVSVSYLVRTNFAYLPGSMCYDCDFHMGFTHTIVNEHRYPKLIESLAVLGGQPKAFHHPPLYYLINALIAPGSLKENIIIHVNFVRFISMVYGVIALLFIYWAISTLTQDMTAKLLVLLYISTTPKFVNMFASYNNDTLATVLSIAILLLAYKCLQEPLKYKVSYLFPLALGALYTKYTAVFPLVCIITICIVNPITKWFPTHKEKRIILILASSILLLLPWIYFQNFSMPNTLPLGVSNSNPHFPTYEDIENGISRTIRIPFLQLPKEAWGDPWVHTLDEPATKKSDYWAYTLISYVIGAVVYLTPPVQVIWFLLFIHLVNFLIAIRLSLKTTITRLALAIILLSHVLHLLYLVYVKFHCASLEHRFIAWNWLLWAILYTNALSNSRFQWFSKKSLIAIGIILNIYVVANGTGHLW